MSESMPSKCDLICQGSWPQLPLESSPSCRTKLESFWRRRSEPNFRCDVLKRASSFALNCRIAAEGLGSWIVPRYATVRPPSRLISNTTTATTSRMWTKLPATPNPSPNPHISSKITSNVHNIDHLQNKNCTVQKLPASTPPVRSERHAPIEPVSTFSSSAAYERSWPSGELLSSIIVRTSLHLIEHCVSAWSRSAGFSGDALPYSFASPRPAWTERLL